MYLENVSESLILVKNAVWTWGKCLVGIVRPNTTRRKLQNKKELGRRFRTCYYLLLQSSNVEESIRRFEKLRLNDEEPLITTTIKLLLPLMTFTLKLSAI